MNKQRIKTVVIVKALRMAARQGYDPRNSVDAAGKAWAWLFKMGNAK